MIIFYEVFFQNNDTSHSVTLLPLGLLNFFYPHEDVDENYAHLYLINFGPHISKCWCLNTQFIPNNGDWIQIADKTDLKRL